MKKHLFFIIFSYAILSSAQFSEDLVLQLHAGTFIDGNSGGTTAGQYIGSDGYIFYGLKLRVCIIVLFL